jgi:cold shock CspA family protein
VVKWLAEQDGVSLIAETKSGTQPIHIAFSKGHLEVVKWLAEQDGVSLTADDKICLNPAGVCAAMTGVVSSVKDLEGKGFGFIKPDNGEAASRRARACSRPHSAQRRAACVVSIQGLGFWV